MAGKRGEGEDRRGSQIKRKATGGDSSKKRGSSKVIKEKAG